MPGKGHSPEQVLSKFRQVEVAVASGKSVGQAVRGIGVTDHTISRSQHVSVCFKFGKARHTRQKVHSPIYAMVHLIITNH
jgi:hypothetical protein